MTFSVVARCHRTGQLGVAAFTAMVGVGKLIPYAYPGVGAIATQATLNPYHGYDGLRVLSAGGSPQQVIEELVHTDAGRAVRQCAVMDNRGNAAQWTGSQTPRWSGDLRGDQVAAQGNRLYGERTLVAALEAFERHADVDLGERLLCAIEAGESTGADTAGTQSGAIFVVENEEYPLWDLRVDHAPDPAAALRKLYGEFHEELMPVIRQLPTRADPTGAATREALSGDQPSS